jgi:adenylylsulfate kinase
VDRDANVRRIGFVARLLARNGVLVMTAAISPYAAIRDEVRALVEAEGVPFLEVFVNPRLESLIARDPKGLYRRAIAGEIEHFTGISDPYEPPPRPELVLVTDQESVEASADRVRRLLADRGLLS